MVLFVFLAVPKACPLTIIWRTQAVSGLAPLQTDTFTGEWEQGGAEKPPKGWCLSSDPGQGFWEEIAVEPPSRGRHVQSNTLFRLVLTNQDRVCDNLH